MNARQRRRVRRLKARVNQGDPKAIRWFVRSLDRWTAGRRRYRLKLNRQSDRLLRSFAWERG